MAVQHGKLNPRKGTNFTAMCMGGPEIRHLCGSKMTLGDNNVSSEQFSVKGTTMYGQILPMITTQYSASY